MSEPHAANSAHETEKGKLIFDAIEVPAQEGPFENDQDAASASATFRAVGKSKVGVLMILFFATGFLGIPLLFYSSRFNTAERVFWSLVVTLYTCALIAVAVWVLMWSWGNVQAAFGF